MSLQLDGFWKGGFWSPNFWVSRFWFEQDQASNWQADYWRHRTKAQRKKDDDEERIRLGILPPEERIEADAAIRDVVDASVDLAMGRMDAPEALLVKMEARQRYEDIYRQAYEEAYIADIVSELWMADMKRAMRRRKAVLLLLH